MERKVDSVIVTGCTSGVGLALHEKLSALPALHLKHVFIGRNLKRLRKVTPHIYCELDLAVSGYIDWSEIYGDSPPKTIVFISNAATIKPIGKITKTNIESFKSALNVNLISPIEALSSLAIWAERFSVSLKIINLSSGASNRAISGWAGYCSAKAGIKMYLDVLSQENDFIDVTHFDPGVIDTGMQELIRQTDETEMPSVGSFITLKVEGKLKSPYDIANQLLDMCGGIL